MNDPDPTLNDRQRKFVEAVARGLSAQEAATQAGFSASYARKASRLLKHQSVRQAIEAVQSEAKTVAAYSLLEAVREIDRQIKGALAARTPNFMAAAKLLELKCKIYGLVREKLEVVSVDLSGALAKAESRMLNITSLGGQSLEGPSTAWRPAHWNPHVSGDPAENPEAGEGNGKSAVEVGIARPRR